MAVGGGADPVYHVQTIIDNVGLLSEGVLRKINKVVAAHGHARLTKKAQQEGLRCRVDSAVTKTHVHWPTDVSLLRDAGICLVRETARLCRSHGIQGWRKEVGWAARLCKLFQRVRRWRGWRCHDRVREYLHHCGKLVKLVKAQQEGLRCRVDSAVTKTHVHWPTDVSLLRDAGICLVRETARLCRSHGIQGWRKEVDWAARLCKLFQRVRRWRGWRCHDRVREYLHHCGKLVKLVNIL